ncbi:MAG: hypothetical protein LBT53_07395 [Puniceicoccales bacterium]|jgi:hypothetical protein|nr:hypothetical protein [Puniceicoccales bacterium]
MPKKTTTTATTATTAATTAAANVDLLTFASPDLSEGGQGRVVVVRPAPKGKDAAQVAIFDVDTQCLGVRGVKIAELPLAAIAGKFLDALRVVSIKAPVALGILAGAAAYAKKLGFTQHALLADGLAFFGDIRQTKPHLAFGKDGKPFYTQQPGDDDDFVEATLARLEKACGQNGFGYLLEEDNEDLLNAEDSGEDSGDLDPDYDGTLADGDFDSDDSGGSGDDSGGDD